MVEGGGGGLYVCGYLNNIIKALIHGLNRHYYSIGINYRKNELEQKMLLNLHKKDWTKGLTLDNFDDHFSANELAVKVRGTTFGILFFSIVLFLFIFYRGSTAYLLT